MNNEDIMASSLPAAEKAAWITYRLMDAANVTGMKRNRAYSIHLWDLNRAHAKAILTMQRVMAALAAEAMRAA